MWVKVTGHRRNPGDPSRRSLAKYSLGHSGQCRYASASAVFVDFAVAFVVAVVAVAVVVAVVALIAVAAGRGGADDLVCLPNLGERLSTKTICLLRGPVPHSSFGSRCRALSPWKYPSMLLFSLTNTFLQDRPSGK